MKTFEYLNVTTTHLLWGLGFHYSELRYFGMVNAFINDKNKLSFAGYFVYILVDKREAKSNNQSIFKSEALIEEYAYGDSLIVYKYKYPKELIEDFEVITSGKYSLLSEKYISYIPEQAKAKNFATGKAFTYRNRILIAVRRAWYFLEDYEKYLGRKLNENEECWKPFDLNNEVLDIIKYL